MPMCQGNKSGSSNPEIDEMWWNKWKVRDECVRARVCADVRVLSGCWDVDGDIGEVGGVMYD